MITSTDPALGSVDDAACGCGRRRRRLSQAMTAVLTRMNGGRLGAASTGAGTAVFLGPSAWLTGSAWEEASSDLIKPCSSLPNRPTRPLRRALRAASLGIWRGDTV